MSRHSLVEAVKQPGKYSKLVFSLVGAAASAAVALGVTAGHFTTVEIINIVIAVVGAFHVWYVTETKDNPNGKAVISGVTAALIAAQSFIASGTSLSLAVWLQIAMAAATAAGIITVPTTRKRPALPASYANNTYVVNVGTPDARTEVRGIEGHVVSGVGPVGDRPGFD